MPATGRPTVTPNVIFLTCGQDVTVETLIGVTLLSINCYAFNASKSLTTKVYKDGELLGGTGVLMIPPSDDDFGAYTFVLSTDCGNATAVSRIIRQGQFSRFTF